MYHLSKMIMFGIYIESFLVCIHIYASLLDGCYNIIRKSHQLKNLHYGYFYGSESCDS